MSEAKRRDEAKDEAPSESKLTGARPEHGVPVVIFGADADSSDDASDDEPSSGSDEALADMAFMQRLQDHTQGMDFLAAVDDHLIGRCHEVDTTLEEGECSHEYWEGFQEFQALVEKMLAGFVASEKGLESEADFFDRCRRIQERGDFDAQYLVCLIASAEFDAYVGMLKGKLSEVLSGAHGQHVAVEGKDGRK